MKDIGKGERFTKKVRKRKKCVPYNVDEAYAKDITDLEGYFREREVKDHFTTRMEYVCKEIRSGDQLEIEIYPRFARITDLPEGYRVRKNPEAQKKLNEKNRIKHLRRKIETNFTDGDLWVTLTIDNEHMPVGTYEEQLSAVKKMLKAYIRRLNTLRKKKGIENTKYICVLGYDEEAKIRWHLHMIMDGALPMDIVEEKWNQSSRNEVRRIRRDENGLAGLSEYVSKQSKRRKYEKSWICSKGNLKNPLEEQFLTKQPEKGKGNHKRMIGYVREMIKDQGTIEHRCKLWHPDYLYTDAQIYVNDTNSGIYIHARMRRRP